MRINEFVEPKRKPVVVEASDKPRIKLLQDGQVEVTVQQNGKSTTKIYKNAKVAEQELKKLKPGAIKNLKDAVAKQLAKHPRVVGGAKWFGKHIFKLFAGMCGAYADLVWTTYAVTSGKMNPNELATTTITAAIAFKGGVRAISLTAVGAVKVFTKLVKATGAFKVIKWIKNSLKIGTAATAAAGPATGGLSWIGMIWVGAGWIATEILAYIGLRIVVGYMIEFFNPAFDDAKKSAEQEHLELLDLQMAIEAANRLQKENPNLGTNNANNPNNANNANNAYNPDAVNAFGTEGIQAGIKAANQIIELAEQKGQAELEALSNERFIFEEDMPTNPVDKKPNWTGFIKNVEKNRSPKDTEKVINTSKISRDQKKIAKKLYVDKDVNGATELLQKYADKKKVS